MHLMIDRRADGSPDGSTGRPRAIGKAKREIAKVFTRLWRWMLRLFGGGRAPEMATVQEWLALSDRLYVKGVDVFSESEVIESSAGTRDPKVVVAPMLPARTLGHFQAAVASRKHAR